MNNNNNNNNFIMTNEAWIQMNQAKMKPSSKAIDQLSERQSRGILNNNSMNIANHSGEVTFNVQLGFNCYFQYYQRGVLKFATLQDAEEYLAEVGATPLSGPSNGWMYYSLMKQEGCSFCSFNYYLANDTF